MENKEKYNCVIKDKMLFNPYNNDGYQCILNTHKGKISVRYKGVNLFANKEKPYEVWYPGEDAPIGYQTAKDIFHFINPTIKMEDIL